MRSTPPPGLLGSSDYRGGQQGLSTTHDRVKVFFNHRNIVPDRRASCLETFVYVYAEQVLPVW
jgi:hypothetical protein